MAKTTSFALSDKLERFLRSEVAQGRYSNVSEVVREALRRMMEYEKKRAALERLIDEGIESAETEPPLTGEQVWRMLGRGKRPRKAPKRK